MITAYMTELNRIQTWVLRVGALVLLAGVALAGSRSGWSAALYALGALMFCPMQMLVRYEGSDFVVLRLRRQQLFALFAIIASAVLYVGEVMEWTPYALRHNYWLVALAIGCVFLVYTTFRIGQEMKKK